MSLWIKSNESKLTEKIRFWQDYGAIAGMNM